LTTSRTKQKIGRMNALRWIHVAFLVVPVLILTAFNVAKIEPSGALIAALSSLTTVSAALAQGRSRQNQESPKPVRKPPARTRRKAVPRATGDAEDPRPAPQQLEPPARAASSSDDSRT
jgi:hypothetical protein